MSSSALSFVRDTNYAAIFIQPILFIFTIIANTLNIIILTRRSLRSFPCTYYFLFYSIFSILYACFTCPLQVLRSYSILWTNTSFGCRIQTYIFQTTTIEANLMILLASIDRFCASSYSAKLRSFSKLKITRWIIPIGISVYAIYMVPLILINYWNDNNNTCIQLSGLHITIYQMSQTILYYILTLLLMAIFSLLTIYNIRGQLSRMLFIQVFAYLLFTLPVGVIQVLMTFVPTMRTPLIQGLRMVFTMWQQCIFFLSFFLFIVTGSIYRQELIRLFKRIYKREELTQTNTGRTLHIPDGTNTRPILTNTKMDTHV